MPRVETTEPALAANLADYRGCEMKRVVLAMILVVLAVPCVALAQVNNCDVNGNHIVAPEMSNAGQFAAAAVGFLGYLALRRRHAARRND